MRWIDWGLATTVVYTLFAASTLGFVAFAMSRPVQLVSTDYYERSLRHDQRARAAERARALGERLHVALVGQAAVLVVRIPPDAAAAARGAVTLYRPSDVAADRTVPLALDAAGQQRVATTALARGRWVVRVEWVGGGQDYFHEASLTLP